MIAQWQVFYYFLSRDKVVENRIFFVVPLWCQDEIFALSFQRSNDRDISAAQDNYRGITKRQNHVTYADSGLVLNSTTLPPIYSIAANSCRSPDMTYTFGIVDNTVRISLRSSINPAQVSCPLKDQSDVKGTDETMNLKVTVELTLYRQLISNSNRVYIYIYRYLLQPVS